MSFYKCSRNLIQLDERMVPFEDVYLYTTSYDHLTINSSNHLFRQVLGVGKSCMSSERQCRHFVSFELPEDILSHVPVRVDRFFIRNQRLDEHHNFCISPSK